MSRFVKLILVVTSIFYAVNSYSCPFLSVNGADDWYPYFARAHTTHNGIMGDVVIMAAERAGIPINVSPALPWKRMLFDLRDGNLDVIAGALKTIQREKQFYFSPPVHHAELKVFARKDRAFNFTQLNDLEGLTGAKVRGMSLGQSVDDFAFSHLVINDVPDPTSLMKMIATKRVDYGIFYSSAGARELKRIKQDNNIVQLETVVSKEGVYVAYSKSSNCQKEISLLDKEITLMLDDGSINEIIAKYYSKKIDVVEEEENEL